MAGQLSPSGVRLGPAQTQRREVYEDSLVESENGETGKRPGEEERCREMNRVESAHRLDREGLSCASANLWRDF